MYQEIKDCLPSDNSRQYRAVDILNELAADNIKINNILDVGCGDGRSIDIFSKLFPAADWIGVDIESSPEVNSRKRNDKQFVTYDGISLPFSDGTFDLIYSYQVLEHCRYPELVLKEIRRVLKTSGFFVGQTSQLEPYHSYSLWNFTYYGFKKIVEDAKLELKVIRPGIDAYALIDRKTSGNDPKYNKYFVEDSPFNSKIQQEGMINKFSHKQINYNKLLYSGVFCFLCRPCLK
jgi:ubiquinone/menaquinone biosynthesis C-methylase UbiE